MMQKQTTGLALIQPTDERIAALDRIANECGLINESGNPFEEAIRTANCMIALRQLLTPEIMAGIMSLQGSQNGFKTDKSYDVDAVREAVIDATLTGVKPIRNQFNIIGGRCYITKEGYGVLLSKVQGLSYSITTGIPKMVSAGAEAPVHIEWEFGGKREARDIIFPVRVNSGMGADGINGKATKKARKWLFEHITGFEMADGDLDDAQPQKQSRFASPIDVTPKDASDAQDAPRKPYGDGAAKMMENQPIGIDDLLAWYEASGYDTAQFDRWVLDGKAMSYINTAKTWKEAQNG